MKDISAPEAKKILSSNITTLMAQKNKTRQEVADATGITYANLSDWINCRTYPRINKIDLLCKYFNVTRTELLDDYIGKKSKPETIHTIAAHAFGKLSEEDAEKVLEFAQYLLSKEKD